MGLNDLRFSRRDLLKIMGSGTASVYLAGCSSFAQQSPASLLPTYGLGPLAEIGPFDRSKGDIAPKVFSGDAPGKAHKILWDKQAYIKSIGGQLPAPEEKVPVVIVGGGMSGLLSAYFMKDQKPVILEQADRFGGNSRGESWGKIDYSLATAYFGIPEKGSAIDTFMKEVGLDGRYREHSGDDDIFIGGKRYTNIWINGTEPESKEQFVKLGVHFKAIMEGEGGDRYPHIPIVEGQTQYVTDLDKMTFKEYVEKVVGGELHPHVEEVIEHYFWSAMAASYTEVSAASGLNFFAADFDKVAVLPGGNGAIAEAVLAKLLLSIPHTNLRPSSLVFDVRVVNNAVLVSYVDSKDRVYTIQAETVIMSCPKFVAQRLIDDFEPERTAALNKLRYRSYLVANVLINKTVKDSFYDLFFFDEKSGKLGDVKTAAEKQKTTDFVYANYNTPNTPHTVLTLFRGFPYDNARQEIYAPNAYEKFRAEFEKQIHHEVLPMMGLQSHDVVDVRLSRWGHPLPVSDVGHIAEARVAQFRKPFKNRVFFVEQDNWALPSFETTFAEARTWTPQARAVINGIQIRRPTYYQQT
jgi:hypothetical protein